MRKRNGRFIKCGVCGKKFYVPRSWIGVKKYCSIECRKKIVKKSGQYKKCSVCGKVYYEYPYLAGKRKYCSRRCANIGNSVANSLSKMGKNNPMFGKKPWNYNGGISTLNTKIRGSKLYKRWARAVKRRDKKCVLCGSTEQLEADHYPISFAMLLDMYNIRSVDDANNYADVLYDLNNGRTLCSKCHQNTDTYKVNLKYQKLIYARN